MLATLIALLAFSHALTVAAPAPGLEAFLNEEVAPMDDAVVNGFAPGGQTPQEKEMFFFRSFTVRIRTKVGFEFPGFAKIEVLPEAEMLWQRPLPEGWTSYKPH